MFIDDILLDHAASSNHAAGLANIWIFRQPIRRTHYVGAKFHFGVSQFILYPVEERDRSAFCVLENASKIRGSAIEKRLRRIVLPGPVHERDLRRLRAQAAPRKERTRRHVVRYRRI